MKDERNIQIRDKKKNTVKDATYVRILGSYDV